MIQVRCACGAPLEESNLTRFARTGLTCWNCGRVWGVVSRRIDLLQATPTRAHTPVSDTEVNSDPLAR